MPFYTLCCLLRKTRIFHKKQTKNKNYFFSPSNLIKYLPNNKSNKNSTAPKGSAVFMQVSQ